MSEEDKVEATVTSSDFTDRTLNCKDCGADWVFSAGEQEFYAEKALENEPTRCKECRKEKKAARNKRMRARRKNKTGPASNVCFAFQKGECTRGDECRFKHEIVDDAEAPTEETTA